MLFNYRQLWFRIRKFFSTNPERKAGHQKEKIKGNTPQGVANIGAEHAAHYEHATDCQKAMIDEVLSLLSDFKTADVEEILFIAKKEAPYRSRMTV